jgi:hypothetical protein
MLGYIAIFFKKKLGHIVIFFKKLGHTVTISEFLERENKKNSCVPESETNICIRCRCLLVIELRRPINLLVTPRYLKFSRHAFVFWTSRNRVPSNYDRRCSLDEGTYMAAASATGQVHPTARRCRLNCRWHRKRVKPF